MTKAGCVASFQCSCDGGQHLATGRMKHTDWRIDQDDHLDAVFYRVVKDKPFVFHLHPHTITTAIVYSSFSPFRWLLLPH